MRSRGASPCVEAVATDVFRIPTSEAGEQDATLTWDQTTMVVVRASALGHVGIGWTYAPAAAAAVVTDLLAPHVEGGHVADVGRAAVLMDMAARNAGRGGLVARARSAVDLALWDLKARVLGCSLVDLLGPVRDEIACYGSGGFTDLDDDDLAGQVRAWSAAGFGQVKIKVGRDPERDRRRVEVVRDAIGADVALYVDANGGYERAEALAWAETFADAGVRWLEEPVTSDDLDGLRSVREHAPAGLDITAGEYVDGLDAACRLVDAGAVDVLQLDVTRCGGITGFLAAEALARAHHVSTSAHCAPIAHLAVAAACPSLRHVEWFHDHARIEQELFDGAPVARGGGLPVCGTDLGTGLSLSARAAGYRLDVAA